MSPEFPLAAVDPLRKPIQVEYPVYGRLPLMHTQTCIIRRINGRCEARGRSCIREPDCRAVLVDRMGEKFPVVRETGHRNVIYNSRPLWNEPEKHPHCGHIWCFTDESTEEIISVLAGGKPRKYTRGNWKNAGTDRNRRCPRYFYRLNVTQSGRMCRRQISISSYC